MKRAVTAGALSVALLTTGCQTTKQDIGTLVGAGLGAVIGAQFGKGSGQIIGVALGTALGGYLGNQIGRMLDEADQQAVSQRAGMALASARDGETINWSNPETGASATLTPLETRTESREVPLLRQKNVAAPPALDLIGETWHATKSANLRAAPGTDSEVVGGLQPGERFQAIGRVSGSDWIMVGRNNRSIGYVHGSLAAKAPPSSPAPAVQPASAETSSGQAAPEQQAAVSQPVTDQEAALRPAIDLDKLQSAGGIDLDAEGLIAETVAVNTQCRTMEMNISRNNESASDTINACKSGDGSWEIL